ncbi:MAG: hypothetical protein FJ304_22570 [Planctomycetes bacterium]|nr:hypothetical protein [Planctomycetota bacterium]
MSARPLVRCALGAILALCASAAPARADLLYIGDSELPGVFTGSIEVKNVSTTAAVVTIKLTNTSPSSTLYLTGLAFNDPNSSTKGNISTVSSFSASYSPATGQNFRLIGGSTGYVDGISTGPFGNLDIGASVGSTWHTSGIVTDGLQTGETGTFTFNVTGTAMNLLSAANIMAAKSTSGAAGIAVRFRDAYSSVNDKDLAAVICPPPPPPPPPGVVPAPPGLVLAGMGFGCLVLGRLRLRRK